MRMEPCGGCGDLRPVGPGSLSPPTCRKCRRQKPKATRISPSVRGTCSQCGKVVQISRTSAPPDSRRCRECQRATSRKKPPWIPQVIICPCGVVFEQHTCRQKYCRPKCRPDYAANRSHRPSASVRGYDHKHRMRRTQAIAALIPGTPCPRCGDPMTADQALDLDHTDDRSDYLGLSHTSCNRSIGATLGNRMRARAASAAA